MIFQERARHWVRKDGSSFTPRRRRQLNKKSNDNSGIRTHAPEDQIIRTKRPPDSGALDHSAMLPTQTSLHEQTLQLCANWRKRINRSSATSSILPVFCLQPRRVGVIFYISSLGSCGWHWVAVVGPVVGLAIAKFLTTNLL
ncbi:hypothetical protein BDN72DRAFT_253216 [Pluteus cervinus]|uniref:Uncharacterized protein n=1 Tax=Pluteus cervinus TaxID=181527 RepID=A0ACD3AGI7_9AGAR|nr:hypothetical protein BDN72DRAFT_253216 [Pluteus cervinus]